MVEKRNVVWVKTPRPDIASVQKNFGETSKVCWRFKNVQIRVKTI